MFVKVPLERFDLGHTVRHLKVIFDPELHFIAYLAFIGKVNGPLHLTATQRESISRSGYGNFLNSGNSKTMLQIKH